MAEVNYRPDPRENPVTVPSRSYGNSAPQQVYQAAAAPTPTDPTKPAVFYPTGGGSLQEWNVPTQTWV